MAKKGRTINKGKSGSGAKAGQAQKRRNWFWPVLISVGIAALVVSFMLTGLNDPLRGVVERHPIQSKTHIPSIETPHAPYSTDPPTSGPHVAAAIPAGFYEERLPYQVLVHNLEHSNAVIYYSTNLAGDETLADLRRLAAEHQDPVNGVIALPRNDHNYEVILTSWGRMVRMETYDPDITRAFIDRFVGSGHY